MLIAFEPLQRGHFGLVALWLAEPLVARWWNHETSTAAIERDFGPSLDGNDATEVFVAVLGDRPVGLIQRYPIDAYPEYVEELSKVCVVAAGALSVDYLIGEPDVRGHGLGAAMIAAFVDQSWPLYPRANDVIVPVSAANRASWRALERAGFRRIAEGDLQPDNPRDSLEHYVYRLQRPRQERSPGACR
ncbi:MAG: acetyltransferase [Chloroflexota bacterium]|nr:acetyltransferase [Chloroflexota bacterium]